MKDLEFDNVSDAWAARKNQEELDRRAEAGCKRLSEDLSGAPLRRYLSLYEVTDQGRVEVADPGQDRGRIYVRVPAVSFIKTVDKP